MTSYDLSVDGFECIRSQEMYPVLKRRFDVEIEVPGVSFARRFVESPFGQNYNPDNPADRAWLDRILEMDEKHMKSHGLKPESVFLILKGIGG